MERDLRLCSLDDPRCVVMFGVCGLDSGAKDFGLHSTAMQAFRVQESSRCSARKNICGNVTDLIISGLAQCSRHDGMERGASQLAEWRTVTGILTLKLLSCEALVEIVHNPSILSPRKYLL